MTQTTSTQNPETQNSSSQNTLITANDALHIGSRTFTSRLLVGTGKYTDLAQTGEAIATSGAQIVTVAIRRVNIGQKKDEPNLLDVISPEKYTILPNTAGCFDAASACLLYTSPSPRD